MEKWISATYLNTSAVVGHPRGQGNQHCSVRQTHRWERELNILRNR